MKFNRLVTTIDTHTGGNPTRTVTSGAPKLLGSTMFEKMIDMKQNYDWFRQALMNEPRGHDVMSGAVLQEPCHPEADIGVIYIETGGYLPMCGHDTIGVCTALVEGGLIPYEEPLTSLKLDTPAGLVAVDLTIKEGKVTNVSFKNVPSFLYKSIIVEVDGLGPINVDIAYGGNFYGIISEDEVGLSLVKANAEKIVETAILIRQTINKQIKVVHPTNSQIRGLTHIEFFTSPENPEANVKNTVVVPPGGIDRSPCGTGTSAKMAVLFSKGELKAEEWFVHESIVGSLFKGKIVEVTDVGGFPATINYIGGSAWVTGFHQFFLNKEDPLIKGFLLIPEGEKEEAN